MTKAEQWKTAVKAVLKRVGAILKTGKEGAPGLLVLRFHSPVDRERGLDMIRRAYRRIPWEVIDLANDNDGTRLYKTLTSGQHTRYLLLWGLPGEPRDIPDEFLSSLELGLKDGEGHDHRVVLCALASAVKILADRVPDAWNAKLGYLAWPLQPGVTEAAIGLDMDDDGDDRDTAADERETRKLLGRLEHSDSAAYLMRVAKSNMMAGEMENARLLLLRAVEIFYVNSDLEGLARTYHLLGEIASVRADHHAALEWVGQALENWRVADSPRGLSETLAFKGFLHYQTEQLDQALKAFEEAMEIDEELRDATRLSAGYRRMAMVFEKNMELARAKGLYEKSLQIEQDQGNDEGIARVFHHLGRLSELDGNWEEATAQYQSSLDLKESLGDEAGMAATWHQLGNLHIKTRQLDDAVACYEKALQLELRVGDGEGQARTLAQLGLARIELDQPEAALRDLVRAYNLLQRLRSPLSGEVLSKLEELQDVIPPETFNAIVRGTAEPSGAPPGDD
jgi:tetratricopeptide (TPR) repeat protein